MTEKQNEPKNIENNEIITTKIDSNNSTIPFINNEHLKEEITDELIYNKLLYSRDSFLFQKKCSNKIIEIYLSEFTIQTGIKIRNKIRMRYASYLTKMLKNNKEIKMKIITKNEYQNKLSQFFISFNKNIWILLSNYKKEKSIENHKKIVKLNHLLKILLNVLGFLYIAQLISDEFFELIIKNTLYFSLEKIKDIKEDKIEELQHMMFFNNSIQIIKIVFNKLYSLQKNYLENQKKLIKNIIIHINSIILNSSSKDSLNFYSNKCLLSENDYKTSLLIELIIIIIRMKSPEIKDHFLNLLLNIYSFSFKYENSMKIILKLTEPLLLNLNNKNLDEIKNEFSLSEFILNYIDVLNNKEKEILKPNNCMLKQGFYFGNKLGTISGDINNNFENDFIILFGFRLEIDEFDNIILFELYNEEKNQIKFCLNKNMNNNYELIAVDGDKEIGTKIYINNKKTYIFEFMFLTEGFFKNKILKIQYIKDDSESIQDQQNITINSCANIKFKNVDNIKKVCLGCDRKGNLNQEHLENKFIGFMGDFIILNAKRVKDNVDAKIYEDILRLKQNYSDVIKLLSDDNKLNVDISYNIEYNSIFNQTKNIYERLKMKTELKSNHTINTIISPKYFKLVDYQDDIDYMNSINNYEYFLKKRNVPLSIKLKYFNYKMKPDPNNKKCLTINSSLFNKQFHLFERKFSLIEFVKYEGIHYLSLLFEYYYQIMCYILETKSTIESNFFKELNKEITEKILKIISFFNINIIQTNLIEYNLVSVEKFFYQMTTAILKLAEMGDLDFEIYKLIVAIINILDSKWEIGENKIYYSISLIKLHLIEFLVNPRIYNKESDSCLEKLNYIFNYLLTFLQKSNIKHLKKIFCEENLEMLFAYTWLLGEPKQKQYFEETKSNYSSLLILFIQMSTYISIIEDESQDSKNEIKITEEENDLKIKTKVSSENLKKIEEKIKNNKKFLISEFFRKTLEHKKNHHIFFNLSEILIKTNLISFLREFDIDDEKTAFLYENHNQEEIDFEHKRTLYFSYLQIVIAYYFSEIKMESQNKLLKKFHEFINSLNLDLDLFYALIAVFRYINKFGKVNTIKLNSYKTEALQKISKDDYPIFSDLPFREIQIDKLNDMEIYIIRNLLLDILYLMDKFERKLNFNSILNNEPSPIKDMETNIAKDFFDIIKKNIDIVFKYPRTKLYEMLFSCESNICSKLFLIKWKYGYEKDLNYIKTVLKKYYKDLVKNYYCPFVYKFLLEIISEKAFRNDSQIEGNNNNETISEFKAEIIMYIISTLNELSKEVNTSKEKMPFYVYNLLNTLIILNEILNYNSDIIFNNSKFYDAIYTFISLVAGGLLYSNFCIEFKDSYGKIISEMVLDIVLAIPAKYFKQNIFFNTFIKKKEKMTIFSIMDHYKEKIIERKKIKNQINFPELDKMKESHNIILSLNPKQRIMNLVEVNKIYQIEEINFLIYFLAKGFVYLRSKFLKEKENQIKVQTLKLFLPCLADDLFLLFTRDQKFYGTKSCGFPLYDETKKYFESYIVQNYKFKGSKNLDLYKKFFHNDLIIILKDEYNLDYCYSSRLYKSKNHKENETNNLNVIEEKNNDTGNKLIIAPEIQDINKNDISNSYIYYTDKTMNNSLNMTNLEMSFDTSFVVLNKENELEKCNEINIIEFPNTFEINNENIINHPRNFFLKNVFSNAFKDIIFYNKTFNIIKKIYFIKFRTFSDVNKETKQKDYPTKQKNYSNFLEPRIFLKRDFNFYDQIYFPISFNYLPETFKNKKLEDLFFYHHNFKFHKKSCKKNICELVTSQYIYFGKLYFFNNHIIFEAEEDPRDDPNSEFDVNILLNYSISTKSKDIYKVKDKFIVIFLNNIKEVIKRRSLLITQSIEIFLKNGKSYFFNFFKRQLANEVYKYFDRAKNVFEFNFDINDNKKEIKNILSLYHSGKISNYDYLLYLNKYSTRTYCDLSQYPVFPWLLLEHEIEDNLDVNSSYLRNMKYPISAQNEKIREKRIKEYKKDLENFDDVEEGEERELPAHSEVHYSNSAFIFYYLMRLNPYGQDLIKLQNYQNENPNRMFISFQGLETILKSGVDNRELIPDFFCYFDFLLNLNCNYLGKLMNGSLNDDFLLKSNKMNKMFEYVHNLYFEKKLLNSVFISTKLYEWVDNIFGKNQFPIDYDSDAIAETCNIYTKYSYEQRTDFEKILESKQNILKNKEIKPNELRVEIKTLRGHLGMSFNFGMTPKQILKTSNVYEKENKPLINEIHKIFDDKVLYFEKISNDEYIFLKNANKKEKNKNKNVGLYVYKNKSLSESKIYDCKGLNLMKKSKNISLQHGNIKTKIPLYNPCYSISYLELKAAKKNKLSHIIILSCRYLGNFFNIQSVDKNINIFCEDFVTCIKANNKENSNTFYTGLFNGKLIEWELSPNFELKEIKHIYSHSSSITVIELYERQNIIITAGEDKYIHIRKQYDFELLTVINLNSDCGYFKSTRNLNIFPSLIKISDLNLLYVLLYDLDSETNFIRGYNLNGLYFAQTDKNLRKDSQNKKMIINNFSFTKNSNLVIGFYYQSKYILLNSWDLNINKTYNLEGIKKREGLNMIIYDYSIDAFNILYENEFIRTVLNEENTTKDF